MTRAIIFDWGGVLIANPADSLRDYCAHHLGVTPAQLQPALNEFIPFFQRGTITEDEFWRCVTARLQIHAPRADSGSLWGDAFQHAYAPQEAMFDLASRLHAAGYRTGLLSNTEPPAVAFFHRQPYTMFDAAIFSCRVGSIKPEPRIYDITLNRLGIPPTQAVFIDDNPLYVRGAQDRGMQAIHFTTVDETRRHLESLLRPALPDNSPLPDKSDFS